MEGTWREEHLFSLEQALQRHDFLEQQIQACEARIATMIDGLTPAPADGTPDSPAPVAQRPADPRSDPATRAALHRMMGVDLTVIPTIGTGTALTVAAEIGPEFSAFPSARHFCSWLGVAPGIVSVATGCRADRRLVRRWAARRVSDCDRRNRRLRGGSRCGRPAGPASPRLAAGAECRTYATARCRCP